MLTRHVGKGGGEEATMETRRSTRSTRSKRALEPTDDELRAALLHAEGSRAGECGLLDPCGRGEVCVTTPDKTWS